MFDFLKQDVTSHVDNHYKFSLCNGSLYRTLNVCEELNVNALEIACSVT